MGRALRDSAKGGRLVQVRYQGLPAVGGIVADLILAGSQRVGREFGLGARQVALRSARKIPGGEPALARPFRTAHVAPLTAGRRPKRPVKTRRRSRQCQTSPSPSSVQKPSPPALRSTIARCAKARAGNSRFRWRSDCSSSPWRRPAPRRPGRKAPAATGLARHQVMAPTFVLSPAAPRPAPVRAVVRIG